ncbi:hypothetical protein [Amycolatopsis jejuensis]|uniref:hypothetical protein n=1 Tax=Amycolatopsis jejuensis TaxID=330084 RepID=UPI0005244CB0|nr:hypothetical protein [Amycolatopsis jejuensis]
MRNPADPLAAAIGNASLLGVGYFLIGRRVLAAVNLVVTVALVVVLTTVAPYRWFELVVLGWWAVVVMHGWFAARDRVANRTHRIIALVVTVLVFAAVGVLRFDAARIDNAIAEARRAGDCPAATRAVDRFWLGDRTANAPLVASERPTVEACRRLETAAAELTAALDGQPAVPAAFAQLRSVLHDLPGHETMATTTLDAFLRRLPTKNACTTASITDLLPTSPLPARPTIDRIGPPAYLACGDRHLSDQDWPGARTWYQRLVDRYPANPLTPKAKDGITRATQAQELATVRDLIQRGTYCTTPAKYSAAPPYGPGTNRALFHGEDEYTAKFPPEWRAPDAAQAVLVVCLGAAEDGTPVRTCPYENKTFPEFPTNVTFHKIAIPLKAYELRTGAAVVDTKVEIGGASCPKVLEYESYIRDFGPPGDVRVAPSDDDIRAAFTGVVQK